MANTFAYKVRNENGEIVRGSIEADNSALVADRLRAMGFALISIEEAKESGLRREIKIPGLGRRVKLKDVSIFSRQFATMINSGLALLKALQILGDQTENEALATVVRQVSDDIENGSALSAALARHPKVFSRLYVAMVRAGRPVVSWTWS